MAPPKPNHRLTHHMAKLRNVDAGCEHILEQYMTARSIMHKMNLSTYSNISVGCWVDAWASLADCCTRWMHLLRTSRPALCKKEAVWIATCNLQRCYANVTKCSRRPTLVITESFGTEAGRKKGPSPKSWLGPMKSAPWCSFSSSSSARLTTSWDVSLHT